MVRPALVVVLVTHDPELAELRGRVDCRTVLEQAGWLLDARESTRHAVKYRNGPAQIVIVTHEGRGWFDPLNDARGDVLALAQRVWGGSIGHARKALRPLAGIMPTLMPAPDHWKAAPLDAPRVWRRAGMVRPGSRGFAYLAEARTLPPATIMQASADDLLREGVQATVWALHRDERGEPCGWEMRGPSYKGFAKGGDKALFVFGAVDQARRVAVTESAIDAMSLAALEGARAGTVYASTGGGFGPRTAQALRLIVRGPARIVAATDRGQGGELLADRLEQLAGQIGCGFSRLRPSAKDWNDQLRDGSKTLRPAEV